MFIINLSIIKVAALNSRKLFSDTGFWTLLLWNIYIIYYQLQHPDAFKTIIWIYWAQSILIGFFNFIDILTLKKVQPGSWTEDGKPVSDTKAKGCAAFFFLFHYGFFHLVYVIFLFTSVKASGPFNFNFFVLSVLVFFMSQLLTLVQKKTLYAKVPGNIGTMFILPYVRIIPMHLTILLPAFLGISALTVFIVLKTLADILFYSITARQYRKAVTVLSD